MIKLHLQMELVRSCALHFIKVWSLKIVPRMYVSHLLLPLLHKKLKCARLVLIIFICKLICIRNLVFVFIGKSYKSLEIVLFICFIKNVF